MNAVEVWESEDSEEETISCERNEALPASSANIHIQIINFICIFLLTWQSLFRIPNVTMGLIYKFISILLKRLSEISTQGLSQIHDLFPDTLRKSQVMQSVNSDNFDQLIVCPRCHSTYERADCMNERDGVKCSYVRFPRHSHQNMRTPCNEKFMKTVIVCCM